MVQCSRRIRVSKSGLGQLARSPAAITLASLEDGASANKRPNLPGAPEDMRPNWCIPLPKKLEEIETDPMVQRIAASLKR